MNTCEIIKVALTLAGLVIAGGFVGFVIARWAYHRLGEFWQDMYEREYGANRTLIRKIDELKDLNLEYERRIKFMTLERFGVPHDGP